MQFILISISIRIRLSYFNVYLSGCGFMYQTFHFPINPSDIFVLTMGWRMDGRKRLSFLVSFFIEYCIQFHEKLENSLFFEKIKEIEKYSKYPSSTIEKLYFGVFDLSEEKGNITK